MSKRIVGDSSPIVPSWWFKHAAYKPPVRRYEVLCFEYDGTPLLGFIVTALPLDLYLEEYGLRLGILHSISDAREGEDTNLI